MANENLYRAPEENSGEPSQASVDSATWDSIINGKSKTAPAASFPNLSAPSTKPAPVIDEEEYPDTENFYDDRPVEEEPFYFDPDEEDISKNFMKDPTDFTDVAKNENHSRFLKIYGLSALAIILLVGGGYLGLKVFMASQETAQREAEATSVQVQKPIAPDAPAKPKKPLLELAVGAPEATPGAVTASVEGSTVVTTDNVALAVKNNTLSPIQIECSTTLTTDFCLAARGADSVDPAKTLDIYYLKDAAHSRIFENPTNFQQTTVAGSLAAASMEINLVAGKPTPVIVVVAPNSSGFMIALPQGTSSSAAAAFASNLSLS